MYWKHQNLRSINHPSPAPFESGENPRLHDEVCAGELTQTVWLHISWTKCLIFLLQDKTHEQRKNNMHRKCIWQKLEYIKDHKRIKHKNKSFNILCNLSHFQLTIRWYNMLEVEHKKLTRGSVSGASSHTRPSNSSSILSILPAEEKYLLLYKTSIMALWCTQWLAICSTRPQDWVQILAKAVGTQSTQKDTMGSPGQSASASPVNSSNVINEDTRHFIWEELKELSETKEGALYYYSSGDRRPR